MSWMPGLVSSIRVIKGARRFDTNVSFRRGERWRVDARVCIILRYSIPGIEVLPAMVS